MDNKNNFNQEGNQYQLDMYINEIKIPNINIKSLSFREWVFDRLIYLELDLIDTGLLYDTSPLYETCPIKIELTKDEKKIVMDFYVALYETSRLSIDSGSMFALKIIALLRPEFMTDITTKSYVNQTSVNVIENICAEHNVVFKKDIESYDIQTWYQINETDLSMLDHLINKSFVAEEDMPLLFLTKENELKYTSLKTICSKEPKYLLINNETSVLDNGIDPIISTVTKEKQDNTKVKVVYYSININEKNISFLNNIEYGYGTNFTHYDLKDFKSYYMNFKYAPMSKAMYRSKENKGLSNSLTFGVYSGNQHKNYLLAATQNKYISSIFFNNYKQVIVNASLDIQIGDKVNLILPSTKGRIIGQSNVDDINSGEYIIGGILHNLNPNGMYNMVLTLFRNGMNPSENKKINNRLE
jgi:hypothetical protein